MKTQGSLLISDPSLSLNVGGFSHGENRTGQIEVVVPHVEVPLLTLIQSLCLF